jgi:hypothetical protein
VLAVQVGVSGDVCLGGWSPEVARRGCGRWPGARGLEAGGRGSLAVMGGGDETGAGGEEKVRFRWLRLRRGRMKPAQVPCVLLAWLGFGKTWATELL